jgi:hypothetical protein
MDQTLAPGTVKKDVGALSQILGVIVEETGTGENVAEGIPIHGYRRVCISAPPIGST